VNQPCSAERCLDACQTICPPACGPFSGSTFDCQECTDEVPACVLPAG
jgi:hypothetical protein